jgi:glycerol-3-phosphate dehydrogenase
MTWITSSRSNQDNVLLDNITATDSPEAALEGVELIIHAVPVQFSLPYLQAIKYDAPLTSTDQESAGAADGGCSCVERAWM